MTGEATGTSWQTCTSPKTYADLALGEYAFEVQAIKGGHASFLPAEYEWEVADLTAPVVTIAEGPSGLVDATSARFVFSADEPATFECRLDPVEEPATAFAPCSSGTTYTGFGLGQHTFEVRAIDASEGENVSTTVTRTWIVADLTAPSISITREAGGDDLGDDGGVRLRRDRQLVGSERDHDRVPPRRSGVRRLRARRRRTPACRRPSTPST